MDYDLININRKLTEISKFKYKFAICFEHIITKITICHTITCEEPGYRK